MAKVVKRTGTRRVDFHLSVDEPLSRKLKRIRGRITRRLSEYRVTVSGLIPVFPSFTGNPNIVYVSSATHLLLFFWIGWSWTILSPSPVDYISRLLTMLCGIVLFWVSSHIILKSIAGFKSADRK